MKKSKILLLLANLVIAVIIFVIVNKKEDQKKDIVFEISELLSNLHSISISEPKKQWAGKNSKR